MLFLHRQLWVSVAVCCHWSQQRHAVGAGRVTPAGRRIGDIPLRPSHPTSVQRAALRGWERSSYLGGAVRETPSATSHCPPCQLWRVPRESHPPPGTRQGPHAALGAPEGKTSPELLLLEKKRFISNRLQESPSESKRAHSFQRGRNNSFIHTSSTDQLRIAEDNSLMPTLAAPILLLKGRTKVQLPLLQTQRWFTVHSWNNQLKLFWGRRLSINTGFGGYMSNPANANIHKGR